MDDGEERVAEALLASLAVEHYEPEVVGVVLEQMHRTVQALLSDARDLALHSGRDAVSARDVRKVDELAAEDGYSARPLPSREAMLEMARVVNEKRIELPDSHGVRLPADDAGKLSARGYALEPNGKVVTKKGPCPPPLWPLWMRACVVSCSCAGGWRAREGRGPRARYQNARKKRLEMVLDASADADYPPVLRSDSDNRG